MGNWVLQTTSDVGLGAGSQNTNLKVKEVEKPKPIPPKIQPSPIRIPIRAIQKDAEVISQSKLIPFDLKVISSGGRGISGEGELGNIILRPSERLLGNNFDNSDGSRVRRNIVEL
jgi:hypothetical protein